MKYLEKNGKEEDTYWRFRCMEDSSTDFDFSSVFFKGDCLLATLKAYRYIKIDGYSAKKIFLKIRDYMGDYGTNSIEKGVKMFIEKDFPKILGDDYMWIESISGKIKIL